MGRPPLRLPSPARECQDGFEHEGPRPIAEAVARTAADWALARGEGRVHTFAQPSLVERPAVVTARQSVAAALGRARRFVAPAAHVVEMADAWVWGTEGAVVTRDGCLVEDLTRVAGRSLENHPIWPEVRRQHLELPGTSAVVAARAAAHNFSHFLADTVPRIELARRTGVEVDHWLVSGTSHRWQTEAFTLLGIGDDELVSMNQHELVRAERLLVPSRSGFAPYTAPWSRDNVLTALGDLAGADQSGRGRRLLLSRSDARWRRLLNEAEVHEALQPYGFELVRLADLSLRAQLALVAASDVIVAAHGAGLAHLFTAPRGGTVVEIAHPAEIHPEYYGLASLADWTHRMVVSSGLEDQGEPVTILDDLWCDPSHVVRELTEAGVDL